MEMRDRVRATSEKLKRQMLGQEKTAGVRGLPAREVVCGHLMKYQRAEKGKKSGGTNGIWNHFKKDHPVEYAAEMALSSHSSEGKKRVAEIFAGER